MVQSLACPGIIMQASRSGISGISQPSHDRPIRPLSGPARTCKSAPSPGHSFPRFLPETRDISDISDISEGANEGD